MKKLSLSIALLTAPLLASCATSLEKVVEANHQQRIGAAYAGKPLAYGSGDGIGAFVAQSETRLTLSDRPGR